MAPGTPHRRGSLSLLPLLALVLTSGGCCTESGARIASGAGETPLSKGTLLCDVKIVVVNAKGKTFPKKVSVRKGVQIVMWVADADELHLDFPENPFPKLVECQGRFCGLILPPNGQIGKSYEYTGFIMRGTDKIKLDPHLEVVK